MSLLTLGDELRQANRRLEARYVIRTVEDYRRYNPRPEDEGEVWVGRGPGGVEVTEVRDDSDLDRFLPIVREYRLPDRAADTPRSSFGRYLILAREHAELQALLSRLPEWEARSEEVAEQASRLGEWAERLEYRMRREFERLFALAREAPTCEAVDFLIDLYFSDDLGFGWHDEALSAFRGVPRDAWEKKLLKGYSSMPLARLWTQPEFLFLLDEAERFSDRRAFRSIVTRWIGELEEMIGSEAPPPPRSAEEKLLSAVFGEAAYPLDHPHELLEELTAVASKLAERDGE